MATYLLIDKDSNKVWNHHKNIWTNIVDAGCRYAGRKVKGTIVPGIACDRKFQSFHASNNPCAVEILCYETLRDDFYYENTRFHFDFSE